MLDRRRILLFALLLLLRWPWPAIGQASDSAPVRITILHTNDMHGGLFPARSEAGDSRIVGGAGALWTYVKRARAADSQILLVDAGDVYQGTPEGDLSRGRASIDVLNAVGYDAMTIGNHEFDQGPRVLRDLAAHARFPFLGANILEETTGLVVPFARPFVVKNVKGLRIALLGITSEATAGVSLPENMEGFRFSGEVETVRKYLAEIREKNLADMVVVITHIGVESDRKMAKAIPELPLIVGGHSHTGLPRPDIGPGGTIILQTWPNGSSVGRLDLSVDPATGRILSHEYDLHTLDPRTDTPDPEMARVLAPHVAEANRVIATDEIVAHARCEHTRDRYEESLMGNWITDAMRRATGAEVAVTNSGGIRADLNEGPITPRNVYRVFPFANRVVKVELKGADLRELLEMTTLRKHGILQVSGVRFAYDSRESEGKRIQSIRVGARPLAPTRSYSVATLEYIAAAGDTEEYGAFLRAHGKITYDSTLFDVAVADLRRTRVLDARIEGRITEIVMRLPRPLLVGRGSGDPLGTWAAAALATAQKTPIGMLPISTLKGRWARGPVTAGNLRGLIRFPSKIATFQWTGRELVDASSILLRSGKVEIHTSGISVEWKGDSPLVRIAGTEISPDSLYRIASTPYLAERRGALSALPIPRNLRQERMTVYDALLEYARKGPPIGGRK